jgi:hypothetical protein
MKRLVSFLMIGAVALALSGCGSCLDPFSKLTDCPKIGAAPAVHIQKSA